MAQPFHDIASQYDLLNDLLSFGLHRHWKKRLARDLLRIQPQPTKILDIATGTGDMAALFSAKIPVESITPLDPCGPMMEKGKIKYPFLKQWTTGTAENLPFPNRSFSLVTCTFGIRNFQNRPRAFQEIARVLAPGGHFGVLEIHPIPDTPLYFPVRTFWQLVVPSLGALFRKKEAYQYLRDTGASFISAEDMVKELSQDFILKSSKALIGGGLVSFLIFERK